VYPISLPSDSLSPHSSWNRDQTWVRSLREGSCSHTMGGCSERHGLTGSRILALSGPARHVHKVSILWSQLPSRVGADWCSIGDSDDDLGRMLGCLRFWFTKDLVGCMQGTGDEALMLARNTSRASRASPTTLRWASSSGYVTPSA